MIRNSIVRWGSVAKFFHWTVSVLVIAALAVGFAIDCFYPKSLKIFVIQCHKSVGLTVLALMIARTLWRLSSKIPRLPITTPKWQATIAHASHFLLYVFVFGMTLSGWIMSTAGGHPTHYFFTFRIDAPFVPESKPLSTFAFSFHHTIAWGLIILLVLHVIGAVKHHFINRDDVLTRMLPSKDTPKD